MSEKKVVVTCDSSCDIGPELCARYSIELNPFAITLGDDVLIDGVTVTPEDLYAYHAKTGKLAKTSATNVAEHISFFKKHTENGNALIFFTISAGMSANYQNACIAAAEFDDVYVIDSANLSTGVGLLVLAAAEMAEKGMDAKTICDEIEQLKPRVNASFIIDSLEYLYKGGRCSALSALGANLLKLKPCIEVKSGAMGVGKKYRGKFEDVLLDYVKERLSNPENLVTDRVFVTHAGCDDAVVDAVVRAVREQVDFNELFVTRAGSTVSGHCGRNTLGVLFIQKSDLN